MSASLHHVAPHTGSAVDCDGGAGRIEWTRHLRLRRRAFVAALVAGVALLALYGAVLTLANSASHVSSELGRLWPWLTALVLGFAAQMGLFFYARGAAKGHNMSAAGVVSSSVTSAASMLACCAHHLTDVLPLVGLTSAALLLANYQQVFLVLGVGSNLVALTYLLAHMKKHGLFPVRSGLLRVALRLPFDQALPVVAIGSLGWLAIAIFGATHH
jgi:hypothetical protein